MHISVSMDIYVLEVDTHKWSWGHNQRSYPYFSTMLFCSKWRILFSNTSKSNLLQLFSKTLHVSVPNLYFDTRNLYFLIYMVKFFWSLSVYTLTMIPFISVYDIPSCGSLCFLTKLILYGYLGFKKQLLFLIMPHIT